MAIRSGDGAYALAHYTNTTAPYIFQPMIAVLLASLKPRTNMVYH
jgi:hypothetical protein